LSNRNSKRLQPTPNPEYTEPQTEEVKGPPPRESNNAFNLSFVVPTESVELPSQGDFYPVSNPMYKKTSVDIKFMTAKEEDVLSANAGKTGALDKLIDSLLITEGVSAGDLLEEDKVAILLAARRSGYGQKYTSDIFCENCKEITAHEFDLSKVSFRDEKTEESHYDAESDTFKFTLPLSNIEVQLLNISPDDNEDIETERKQKQKYNLPFNFTIAFLKTAMISANGVTDRAELEKLIEVLPAADAKEILNFFSTCRPTVDTTQEVTCPACSHVSEREVPLSWAFFRTDI